MTECRTEFVNRPYADPQHEGNTSRYHTGKFCIEPGCIEPAGTWWSSHWCFKHNVERMDRIAASLKDMSKTKQTPPQIDTEIARVKE